MNEAGTTHAHSGPAGATLLGAVAARQRRSVTQLLPQQLETMRKTYAALQALTDDRGYQFYAGIHGLPLPKYCKIAHGQPFFLPWHRAYLYSFELALRDRAAALKLRVGDATIPWWDWSQVRKIPPTLANKTAGGKKNPLFSVRINDLALQQGRRDPEDSNAHELAGHLDTFRQPNRPGVRPLPTAKAVQAVLGRSEFFDFQDALEQLHNDVHVWVGGHMGDIAFSAYDPIFWSHHAMIDRIWRVWQTRHPQTTLPEAFLRVVMQPFGLTVRDTLDVIALGYDYAFATAHDPGRG